MKLCFDSIEEVQEFVKKLKGTRGKGGKDEADEVPGNPNVPAPMQPPQGGMQGFPGPGSSGFAPPGQGAGPATGFPVQGAPATVMSPEAQFVAGKINPRLDELVKAGHNMDQMTNWFRAECSKIDPAAANATLDQIKSTFLPKFQMPALQHIAGLIGVPQG